jgi:diguanylate cyclase (GGDEF)-like protein
MGDTSILVIDDDQAIHDAIRDTLDRIADRTLHAHLPGEGIRIANHEKPDVILLDINMPEMDGYKVCRHLKENAATRDIPVLFLTVDAEVKHLAKALDCGGSDYIRKPFNPVELEARVRVALRTKRTFDLLKEQARFDALTGLHNRAALDDALAAAASAHERTGQPLGLLMVDLDDFKEINDRYGHGVGDGVLREIGASIRAQCRPYDVACRFGGDEFTVILGQTEGRDARQVADRILSGIGAATVRAGREWVRTTGSAGLVSTAEMPGDFTSTQLLNAADAALYAAKRSGRGKLVVASADQIPVR